MELLLPPQLIGKRHCPQRRAQTKGLQKEGTLHRHKSFFAFHGMQLKRSRMCILFMKYRICGKTTDRKGVGNEVNGFTCRPRISNEREKQWIQEVV